jgi:hypothetical protein
LLAIALAAIFQPSVWTVSWDRHGELVQIAGYLRRNQRA